jgi:hypothetical protein
MITLALEEVTRHDFHYKCDFNKLVCNFGGESCSKYLQEILHTPIYVLFGIDDLMPKVTHTILNSIDEFDIEFDIEEIVGEYSIIEVCGCVNDKLIKYFEKNSEEIYGVSSRKFEEIVAELFNGFGFEVELMKKSHDKGRDIIAIKKSDIVSVKYLIECKRYTPNRCVGIGIIQRIHGVMHEVRATKGFVVTTSYFSKPAKSIFEDYKWELEGKDYEDLKKWLKLYVEIKEGKKED